MYLDAADEHMQEKLLAAAKNLAAQGLVEMTGDSARATEALVSRAAEFHATKEQALGRIARETRVREGVKAVFTTENTEGTKKRSAKGKSKSNRGFSRVSTDNTFGPPTRTSAEG